MIAHPTCSIGNHTHFSALSKAEQVAVKQRYCLHSLLCLAYQVTRSALMCLWLALILSSPLVASEFINYCREKLEKAESLFAECKLNTRPLLREFLPGGRGAPVKEVHRVWLASLEAQGHFGFGCVLDEASNVRFFGIYFALEPRSHRLVGGADLVFADFSGNVGLRTKDGTFFVLLAMHGFARPGWRARTTSIDCVMPPFDPDANSTLFDRGRMLVSVGPLQKGVASVRTCWNVDRGMDERNCANSLYYVFLNERNARLLYISPLADTMIAANGQVSMRKSNFDGLCKARDSAPIGYSGFMKEACGLQTQEFWK